LSYPGGQISIEASLHGGIGADKPCRGKLLGDSGDALDSGIEGEEKGNDRGNPQPKIGGNREIQGEDRDEP